MTHRHTPPLPPVKKLDVPNYDAVHQPPARAKSFPWWALLVMIIIPIIVVMIAWTIFVIGHRAGSSAQPLEVTSPSEPGAQTLESQSVVTATKTSTPRPTSTLIPPTALPTLAPTAMPSATPSEPFVGAPELIGQSALGRPLIVYRLGHGPRKRALIGAIHGGYEWNTAELMTRTLDYLSSYPDAVPPDLTLYILPIANPDGYAAGHDAIKGRVNGHQVDLNRNWDYHWGPTATHGTRPVSAGTAPFSEPETVAMRNFIMNNQIEAVIFYHSALAKVFPGAVTTNSRTIELAQLIAQATGYKYSPEGVPGQITTGDAIDWLTLNGITAIEVELTTHQDIDWEQNLAGLRVFLKWDLPGDATPTGELATATPVVGRRVYVVQPGDTLSGIAGKFNVSVEALARANNIADVDSITAGQELIIP